MTSQVNKIENAKITKNQLFFTIFLILNTSMTKAKKNAGCEATTSPAPSSNILGGRLYVN